MTFQHPGASIFVPDGLPAGAALARTTHLGIGAHADDLEFMALPGIVACHGSTAEWFGGVTCTDGAGSVRTGAFAGLSDLELREVRRREQDLAAQIGGYGVMIQLGYTSAEVRNARDPALRADLLTILRTVHPRVVYTHNLADKHETHVAVAVAALMTIRAMPSGERPEAVYGCEVWRGLDWLSDADKVRQDVSGHEVLATALNGAFRSQIEGGKRYDLGVLGRRAANATFADPRAADDASQVCLAMDLTPLAHNDALDPIAYVDGYIKRFQEDMRAKLQECLVQPD